MHPAVLPEEGMGTNIPRERGHPDDLTAVVDAQCQVVCSSEVSEIGHLAVIPEERIKGGYARSRIWRKANVRRADDYTGPLIVASGTRNSIRSTQRADVLNLAVLPNECSHLCRAWKKGEGIRNV